MQEHHPVALSKGTVKSINSSILQQLIDGCHQLNTNQALDIIYQIPRKLSYGERTKRLFITE